MQKIPQLSVTPSSTTTTIPGSAKRRSTRIPRQSEEAVGSSDIANAMGHKSSVKNIDQANSIGSSSTLAEGWKHPAELQYIRRADWSQDLMITYLCQKAFTVPPRQANTTLSYTEITRSHSGEKINIPRGYRIPLMFVAKFQWESLRLVLNSASEWEEYKFDIIHLSRLCTHFFKQAKAAASENKLTKSWRSPMFDRALIRFYRKWMVSREWSVKKFWEEFEEDEYQLDVLKFDWSRWVLKGHKGFALTKEEVQNGITADQYIHGLKRKPDGTWMWGGDDSSAKDASSLDALNSLASQDAVDAITDATPSHDSLEVKQEFLELDNEGVVTNSNGKRRRVEDGDSPVRQGKKHLPAKRSNGRKKTTARFYPRPPGDEGLKNVKSNQQQEGIAMDKDSQPSSLTKSPRKAVARFKPSPSPLSSDEERLENVKSNQPEEDTVMDKDSQPFSLTNTLKTIPLPHDRKPGVLLTNIPHKTPPPTTTAMSQTPIDLPSDHKPDPPIIPPPTSTDDPALARARRTPTIPWGLDSSSDSDCSEGHKADEADDDDWKSMPFCLDVPSTVTPNGQVPATTRIRSPTRPLEIPESAQSEAPGNSNVSNEESNPISATTAIEPLGSSIQKDSADPEVVPNAEASDPLIAGDLFVDAPLPPQSSILPSPPATDPSASTNPTITFPVTSPPPSSSVPEATLPTPPISGSTTLTRDPSASSSSCSVATNIHEDRPDGFDSGNGNQDLGFDFPPHFRVDLVQSILDTVQRMAASSQIREPQTTTTERVVTEGSTLMEAGEERNVVEDSTIIPLSPVLFPGEVETTVVRAQSVVEKVDAEENGAGSEVMDGEDPTTIAPTDSGSETVSGEVKVGGEDMVDESEVVDTMTDLAHDTNGVDVRTENAVEVGIAQSRQETSTVDDIDGMDVAMEKGAVEVQPQSRQETPTINDMERLGIALEMGTVEGQSLNFPPFMGTPTAPSKAAHHSVMESVLSHAELEGGDSREVEITHAEDKMNVDEEVIQPIQPTPPLPSDANSATNTLFMTPTVRTKSLHNIQLLQGLIHFLRMPAQDRQQKVSRILEDELANLKNQATCPAAEQAHYPLLAGPRLLTEEAISVDQRLDVLAHASVTLAKNLYGYRGKELETRIDLLDKSLQQQSEMIQKQGSRSYGEIVEPLKEVNADPDAEFDRNTALMSTLTISQAVQTSSFHVDRQFESVEVQTEAEKEVPAPQKPLTPDATMVDLTISTPPLKEAPSFSAKEEPQPDNNRSVAKTVMSMMRNMADLLECATQGTSQGSVRSPKGKEKEVIDVEMMPSYLDSPTLTTILDEFKAMKEEMRRSQHRSQSEVESMRLSHFMEVEALKDEIRNIQDRGKQELDEVTRRYSEEIGELKTTIRLREERERARDRDKESGPEAKSPSLELLEIRRRVASLEARSRSDSTDMLRSASRSSMTNGHFLEPVVARHPNFNPPHLIPTDFEEQPFTATFRPPRQFMREGSMSKPGTPAPSDRNHFSNRHPDAMDLDESMLLPAKSQRKMHMMNFPRPPMG